MIIKSLAIENFRVFKGKHELNLSPKAKQPIILFGGLNGAGKTSILTAIRLCFLGRLAFERNLTNKEYAQELAKLVHDTGHQTAHSASLNITFEYYKNGEKQINILKRSWNKGEVDNVILFDANEKQLTHDNEQTQSMLLELVPPGIANLVFFDGEKIASLAEDNTGLALKSALQKLLGLDTISRLQEDLKVYLRKAGSTDKKGLEAELENLSALKDEKIKLGNKARNNAELQFNAIVEITKKVQGAEQDLLAGGGAWVVNKEKEKGLIDQKLKEKAVIESQINAELEKYYPLAFAKNTLSELLSNIKEDQNKQHKQIFLAQLQSFLNLNNVSSKFDVEELTRLSCDFAAAKDITLEFELSDRQLAIMEDILVNKVQLADNEIKRLKSELTNISKEISIASKNIARAPEQELVKLAFENLRTIEQEKSSLVKQYKSLLQLAKNEFLEAQKATQKLNKLSNELRLSFGDNESTDRALNSVNLLKDFSKRLTIERLKELEAAFHYSYNRLARKDDIHFSVSIDATSFDVQLINESNQVIDRSVLSAGEKQIFAIAMLDALGKVSGKKLPVVIDTPLGRLDSNHRNKLIENYFPVAAEQMIILSTDTEVDHGYFDSLKSCISHSYAIEFNQDSKSSYIRNGYFWNNKELS
ncbi:DNA sulfur modification protein DndD [Pseudoalteromonas spongiae]|uniref:DNA sulfur modification protein DndD n=1 Tax=Pseudoalteromonas spongiae TaxID=298657 RepID=A0ABU8EUS5_9GAMM